jgi:hypothetical protein
LERSIRGSRSFSIYVPLEEAYLLEACRVGGHPAICRHKRDDEESKGMSHILVIEDDVLDPFVQVLIVTGDEIPFDEVLKIAEGVR